jgi:hypothetical protein
MAPADDVDPQGYSLYGRGFYVRRGVEHENVPEHFLLPSTRIDSKPPKGRRNQILGIIADASITHTGNCLFPDSSIPCTSPKTEMLVGTEHHGG